MADETPQFRHERKFAIGGVPVEAVKATVRHHPALFFAEFAPRTINNIYFDTPDLRNYHQNVEGHRIRSKLRIRWYGELFGALPKAVLEHKKKSGLLGTKRTAALRPFEFRPGTAAHALRDWLAGCLLPEDLRCESQQTAPTLVNRYRRDYYRSADRRIRLTVDSSLAFCRYQRCTGNFLVHAALPGVVVELKYADAAAGLAADVASRLPFRMTRMSKYVVGLDAVGLG